MTAMKQAWDSHFYVILYILLIDRMKKSKDNEAFLRSMNTGSGGD
jgi:hypothetical protein